MTKHHEPFVIHARVYYEDTDAGGIVYHANYLKFAERGRTEYLRAVGWDRARVEKEFGVGFIVRHAEIDYKAPARLDDLLAVKTSVTTVGNTSMTMQQDIWRDDTLLAAIKIVIVAVNAEGRPMRFPQALRNLHH